jgi:hypothetical protein
MEYAVAHLVEALRYKLDDRGFDSRFYHGDFSLKGKTPLVTMV